MSLLTELGISLARFYKYAAPDGAEEKMRGGMNCFALDSNLAGNSVST
jgi:hypothetical protein